MILAPLLLFVCTGNICRSPMAAAIARDLAAREHVDLRVASAGTAAFDGNPPTQGACEAMNEIGIDISDHRARHIDAALIREARLAVAVTGRHRAFLRELDPQRASAIVSFNDVTGLGEVLDPIYGGADEYRAVRSILVDGMPRVLDAVRELAARDELQVGKEAREK